MNSPDWFRYKVSLLSFWFANHADLIKSTNLEINAEYIAMKRRAAGVSGIMSTARRFKFPTFPVGIQRSHSSRHFHRFHRLT
jgi:hypothetical protein